MPGLVYLGAKTHGRWVTFALTNEYFMLLCYLIKDLSIVHALRY